MQDLQDRILARTRELLTQAASQLGIALPQPQVRFDLRGRAAGQARFGHREPWIIRYNPVLMAENPEAFLAETVPHEVAHLAAYARHGTQIRPHGIEWQSIMKGLGATPERCHRFDISGLKTRRLREYDYHCGCQNHTLSSIRHNRVLAGQTYRCLRCSATLRPGRWPEPDR